MSHLSPCRLVSILAVVQAVAVTIFLRGFLLARFELPDVSSCSEQQLLHDEQPVYVDKEKGGCWTDPAFNRAVLVIIDALCWGFVFGNNQTSRMPKTMALLEDAGAAGAAFKFVADTPTITMSRLKAILTGGLPTFLDVGQSFSAATITEDNLLRQMRDHSLRVVVMGDETWAQLAPPASYAACHPYPAFDVRDLHTVDDGVWQNLMPYLRWPHGTAHPNCTHPTAPPSAAARRSQGVRFEGEDAGSGGAAEGEPTPHARCDAASAAGRAVEPSQGCACGWAAVERSGAVAGGTDGGCALTSSPVPTASAFAELPESGSCATPPGGGGAASELAGAVGCVGEAVAAASVSGSRQAAQDEAAAGAGAGAPPADDANPASCVSANPAAAVATAGGEAEAEAVGRQLSGAAAPPSPPPSQSPGGPGEAPAAPAGSGRRRGVGVSEPGWDVLVAHYLGVDHAGHTYGSSSAEMYDKLTQMDEQVAVVAETLLAGASPGEGPYGRTLLLVMGDHGQTMSGDHGGGSDEERDTVLLAFNVGAWRAARDARSPGSTSATAPPPGDATASTTAAKQPICGASDTQGASPATEEDLTGLWEAHAPPAAPFAPEAVAAAPEAMPQIDLTPTLSLLLGLPIPFGNLGKVNRRLWELGHGHAAVEGGPTANLEAGTGPVPKAPGPGGDGRGAEEARAGAIGAGAASAASEAGAEARRQHKRRSYVSALRANARQVYRYLSAYAARGGGLPGAELSACGQLLVAAEAADSAAAAAAASANAAELGGSAEEATTNIADTATAGNAGTGEAVPRRAGLGGEAAAEAEAGAEAGYTAFLECAVGLARRKFTRFHPAAVWGGAGLALGCVAVHVWLLGRLAPWRSLLSPASCVGGGAALLHALGLFSANWIQGEGRILCATLAALTLLAWLRAAAAAAVAAGGGAAAAEAEAEAAAPASRSKQLPHRSVNAAKDSGGEHGAAVDGHGEERRQQQRREQFRTCHEGGGFPAAGPLPVVPVRATATAGGAAAGPRAAAAAAVAPAPAPASASACAQRSTPYSQWQGAGAPQVDPSPRPRSAERGRWRVQARLAALAAVALACNLFLFHYSLIDRWGSDPHDKRQLAAAGVGVGVGVPSGPAPHAAGGNDGAGGAGAAGPAHGAGAGAGTGGTGAGGVGSAVLETLLPLALLPLLLEWVQSRAASHLRGAVAVASPDAAAAGQAAAAAAAAARAEGDEATAEGGAGALPRLRVSSRRRGRTRVGRALGVAPYPLVAAWWGLQLLRYPPAAHDVAAAAGSAWRLLLGLSSRLLAVQPPLRGSGTAGRPAAETATAAVLATSARALGRVWAGLWRRVPLPLRALHRAALPQALIAATESSAMAAVTGFAGAVLHTPLRLLLPRAVYCLAGAALAQLLRAWLRHWAAQRQRQRRRRQRRQLQRQGLGAAQEEQEKVDVQDQAGEARDPALASASALAEAEAEAARWDAGCGVVGSSTAVVALLLGRRGPAMALLLWAHGAALTGLLLARPPRPRPPGSRDSVVVVVGGGGHDSGGGSGYTCNVGSDGGGDGGGGGGGEQSGAEPVQLWKAGGAAGPEEPPAALAVAAGCVLALAGSHAFFLTGHFCEFSGLQYDSPFVGFERMTWAATPALFWLNSFGALMLPAMALPIFAAAAAGGGGNGAAGGRGAPAAAAAAAVMVVSLSACRAAALAAAVLCGAIQRFHVVVWALFAPKLLFEVCFAASTQVALALAAMWV